MPYVDPSCGRALVILLSLAMFAGFRCEHLNIMVGYLGFRSLDKWNIANGGEIILKYSYERRQSLGEVDTCYVH